MLTMPLPCKIVSSFSSKIVVTLFSSGSDRVVEDTLSIAPNSLSRVIDVTWVNLTKEDVQTIEIALQSSTASKRLTWNGLNYLLEEGYSVNVTANKPSISASFRRVV
jgi:hypothetical protein